jgi:uncharacterized protein YgbK (DUF1537 family)
MRRLRLLADDLTGALDTAAQFTRACGPVTVRFRNDDWHVPAACLAFDTATREAGESRVAAEMGRLARFFAESSIAFRKLDSQLRGHPALELERAFSLGGFASAVIAPAFPAQGRVTRGGVQHVRELEGGWRQVRPGFPRELAALGLEATLAARPDAIAACGVFLCDAETDQDLAAIVTAGKRLAPPVLWCGSAGLARALAGAAAPVKPVPGEPFLAIVGSGHPVARAQLDRVDGAHPELRIAVREGAAEAEAVRACIAARGAALVTFLLPDCMFDAEASRRLAAILAELAPRLDRPEGLFVSGGETLRGLADAVDADAFEVTGEIGPGLPAARVCGGRWDGVELVSKSGGFGEPDLLARLLARAGAPLEA